jgi:autotransporter-associated beta strand protein
MFRRLSFFRFLAVAVGAALVSANSNAQTLPAFPGAEGAGAFARGGRGGDVYYVTNLNSSGAGSLAEGLATVPSAGRTILFAVSGLIRVPGGDRLRVTTSKVTIAGQSAPGDGIGLKGGTFWVSGDDIVIRHVRFRYGKQTAGGDAIDLDSGSANVIFDHCDFMFGTDENFSTWSPPENLTMQWSMNAWGLESHSCGGLWNTNQATAHHTLWAHNHTRNPKARPGLLDWVNNVTFDWDIGFIMGDSETPANWRSNVRSSYFVGLAGNAKSFALEKARLDRNGNPNFSLFIEDALLDGNVNGILDVSNQGHAIVRGTYTTASTPFATVGVPVTRDDARTAYKKVVSSVGPLRLQVDSGKALRDEVGTILIDNVVTQKRHHISSETQTGASNGGMGTYTSVPPPMDSDRDGLPDYWEVAIGSDPGVATNNVHVPAGAFVPSVPAGYTLLEEYLHFLTIPHASMPRNTTADPTLVEVDLRKFTSGFTENPVFTISGITNGTVTQTGPGGSLARFVPTVNYAGRARFNFTVTDGDGSTWTQTCAIMVSASGVPKSLYWLGGLAGNTWDSVTPNFRRDTTATTFGVGDSVTFDETGSNVSPVSLSGTMLPGAISINATKNYTFGGSGALGGAMAMLKEGTGSLTLSNTTANSFSGGLILNEGAIVMGNATAHTSGLGAGKVTINRGSLTLFNAGLGLPGAGVFPNELVINGEASIIAPPRGGIGGNVSGPGKLNLLVPYVRNDTTGNWSAFSGTLNVTSDTDGGDFRASSMAGYPAARINLGERVWMYLTTTPSGGASLDIGQLNGAATSSLRGGPTPGRAVTWRIGTLDGDSDFAGTIGEVSGGGPTNLTKVGAGTLWLRGANSYTGPTLVSDGALRVTGSLGTSAITVASEATLGGAGVAGGIVTAQAGSILDPGDVPGSAGRLRVGAGLALQGATIPLQLSSVPGGSDAIEMSGGVLALSGTNTLQLNFSDGVLAAGTYDLISGGSSTSGSLANLAYELPTDTRQTYVLTLTGGGVRLAVTGDAAALTWLGSAGGIWDLGGTANWSGVTPGVFRNLDAVTFGDAASTGSVVINGAVQPRLISFPGNARAYSLGGAGVIAGKASLSKTGVASLAIAGGHTFSGGSMLLGGTVVLESAPANSGGLGTGPVTLGGTLSMFSAGLTTHAGTLPNDLFIPGSGRLNAAPRCGIAGRLSGAGVLTLFSPYVRADITGDWSAFTGRINVIGDGDGGDFRFGTNYSYPGFPSVLVDLGDRVNAYFNGIVSSGSGTTIDIGDVSGTALSTLRGGPTGSRNFTYRIGARNGVATFAGSILEQTSTTVTHLVKVGTGSWTLSGTSVLNGRTSVESGTLRISGSVQSGGVVDVSSGATLQMDGGEVASDAINIASGANLLGDGKLTGDLNNSGTVTCGGGTLTVTGDIVNSGTMRFTGGARLQCGGAFVNDGILDLLTGTQDLPATFENNGVVIDSSSLREVKITRAGGSIIVSLQSYVGHTYQLQRADSISTPLWINVGIAVSGDGAILNLQDSSASGSQGFYRVVVAP